MSDKRIVVPEGMLEEFYRGHATCPRGKPAMEVALEAALRWLSENPIVPTDEQMDALTNEVPYQDSGNGSIFRVVIDKWQRRMFLAHKPEVPEEIADLIVESNSHCTFISDGINGIILAAFRRGQQCAKMNSHL